MSTNQPEQRPDHAPGRAGWIVVAVLAVLNVIVFSILFYKFLWPWWSGSHTDLLLLDGLREQRARLEILEAAPCDSPEMQRYQRGEIGPVIRNEEAPQAAAPTDTTGTEPATAPEAEPPANAVAEPPTTPAPEEAAPPAEASAAPATPTPPAPADAPPAAPATNSTPLSGGEVLPPAQLRGVVDRAVVRILAVQGADQMTTGTGFAISADTIVTNRHVVEGANDDQIFIASKFLGGEPLRARLLTKSANSDFGSSDFAVLRLENGKALTPLNIGDDPQPLENVVAAGYPGITVQSDSNNTIPDVVYSQGDVSVVQPQSNGISLVIHTANIAPGSSGGPLINRCGTLVGVNTFVSSGEQSEGRALYALSGRSLAQFLKTANIPYSTPSAGECASGAN